MRELNLINEELDLVIEEQQTNIINIRNIKREKDVLQKLNEQLSDIEKQLMKEEKDVEKLKTVSFSNFFQTVMNNKDEKLREEEKEVMEVKAKLDQVLFNMDETEIQLKELEAVKIDELMLKSKYNLLFNEKIECLQVVKPECYQEIMDNSKKIEALKLNQKEIEEAINAGQQSLAQVEVILGSLQSAANWGTYDMLGGGMIATMAKRGHMNDAQNEMQNFQRTLATFNKELMDVSDKVVMELQLSGFLDMADYFFDGFFVDWAVQDKINSARTQVVQLQNKIKSIVNQLQNELVTLKGEAKLLETLNIDLVLGLS